jgi:hypothetical protein
MTAPFDSRIGMLWTNSVCTDRVLVLASETPITGTPTGDGTQYVPDAAFGSGTYSADFSAGAYPVYVGTGENLTVTGLTNGTLYYFAIYTYYNGSWSLPLIFTETPVEGCAELGGDHVFINEFHYWNYLIDQDEGVEIAGPAGTDLAIYEVYIYNRTHQGLTPNNGLLQHAVSLSGIIDDETGGRGAVWIPIPDMPDNSGAIALFNVVSQEFVQFFAYRRDVFAEDGPAEGMTADAIYYGSGLGSGVAVEFPSQTEIGNTLQLLGTGNCPDDFGWGRRQGTRGELNGDQVFLPVELLSFQARPVEDRVLLTWQTANEQQSDYFLIEHSTDARSFTSLGKVTAAGYSSTLQSYELWDQQPAPGLNYYRLRQVDFDGTIHDHGLAVVRFAGDPDEVSVDVFPNPVTDQMTVFWSAEATQLWLFDINGRPLRQQTLAGASGSLALDLSSLPGGVYLLHLETPRGVQVRRIIKR